MENISMRPVYYYQPHSLRKSLREFLSPRRLNVKSSALSVFDLIKIESFDDSLFAKTIAVSLPPGAKANLPSLDMSQFSACASCSLRRPPILDIIGVVNPSSVVAKEKSATDNPRYPSFLFSLQKKKRYASEYSLDLTRVKKLAESSIGDTLFCQEIHLL